MSLFEGQRVQILQESDPIHPFLNHNAFRDANSEICQLKMLISLLELLTFLLTNSQRGLRDCLSCVWAANVLCVTFSWVSSGLIPRIYSVG